MIVRRGIGIGIGMLLVAALGGCPKKDAPAGGDAGASTSASTSASASTSTSTSTSTSVNSPPATRAFGGKYTVSTGTMYVPAEKDWASVKFKNDDSKLLGDGELTLAIDPSGRVSGTTEGGPLGAAVLEGTSDGQTLTATVRRKDPGDDGLTGTLVAKIAGDKLEGTMKLAEFNAAVVRVGTFTATKK